MDISTVGWYGSDVMVKSKRSPQNGCSAHFWGMGARVMRSRHELQSVGMFGCWSLGSKGYMLQASSSYTMSSRNVKNITPEHLTASVRGASAHRMGNLVALLGRALN